MICHMHADVGPWWPEGFPCHKRRGRGDDITSVDAEISFPQGFFQLIPQKDQVSLTKPPWMGRLIVTGP